MNLATAGSAKRGMEVGIRKVMGAGKKGLVGQFLGESMVLTFLSLVIAILLVILLLPLFNQLSGKTLFLSDLFSPKIAITFLVMAVLTGLLAGSYPAFYLSLFSPSEAIKGRFSNSVSATSLRKGLVVFQFVVAIGLVVATIVIRHQITYMNNKPLGFNKEQQIVIPLRSDEARKEYATLRNEILQNNHITGASGTYYYPGIVNPSDMSLFRPDQSINEMSVVKNKSGSSRFYEDDGF